jgi:hypothetical protein
MTLAQWKTICDDITHRMLEYTRPYVTPLSSRTSAGFRKLEGSGSYVTYEDERLLLTCEHVERGNQLDQQFFDLTKDYAVANPFFCQAASRGCSVELCSRLYVVWHKSPGTGNSILQIRRETRAV